MLSVLDANYNGKKYSVYISDNAINGLNLFLSSIKKKIVIICDSYFKNTKNHLDENLSNLLKENDVFYFKSGIKNKNINYINKIIKFLYSKNVTRDSYIVSIGGGVVGDISSFVASIYYRGLNFVHVPTSMTSMIDSSIGGKTGFNHLDVVNLCGTYYHPKNIFIDLRFLNSLNKRDYLSGIAEVIKKGIILDQTIFNFMKKNNKLILKRDIKVLFEMVVKSVQLKLMITSSDEKENNQRLLLNYGHTFGQAIESYFGINQNKITHGEAVALGIISASKLCDIKNKSKTLNNNKKIIKSFLLPTKISDLKINSKLNLNRLIKNLENDKKKTFSGIRFIISKKIGSGSIIYEKNNNFIKKSFKEII